MLGGLATPAPETTSTTTQIAPEPTTVDAQDQLETSETSNSVSADEGANRTQTSESTSDSSDALFSDIKPSLDDIPEDLRSQVETKIKDIEKQFKSAYTKKRMGETEAQKTLAAQYEQALREKAWLEQAAMDVLLNPSKLDEYRKAYNIQTPKVDGEAIPEDIQDVGQLLAYLDKRYETKLKSIQQETARTAESVVQQHQTIQRWDSALNRWRENDSTFKRYEKVITTMAQSDPRYRQQYLGNNEWEVLGNVLEDFKSMMREDLERAKAEGLNAIEKKKKASTISPTSKPIDSIQHSAGSGGAPLTKEQIIAKIQSRLGR